jgi:hypothetical protein
MDQNLKIQDRIKKLSSLFKKNNIDGYFVPSTDEYLSEYSTIENETTTKNVKMDEYVHNLNRITRMMEDKNVDKVSRHMNILLK